MNPDELHRLLAKVHRVHFKCSMHDLARIGITHGQPRILHHLADHDGCAQKDLSRQFDLEPATVTNILALMEANGLVRRASDPEDRRVLRVFITPKGQQAHARVEEVFAGLEEEALKGFSGQDRRALLELLGRLYENLKQVQEGRLP
ncbi:MAG TPA: MarR family transcriptional regulator [Holophaga sp.]|nr:MarR family transcriptional regulator [Holophaga sp.]